jgi:hypothetical protein
MKPFLPTTKGALVDAVKNVDVTFIADFHTYDQAQRTALLIMREVTKNSETPWMIGLELIPSQYQRDLDRFQRGEISEAVFLERISYAEEWGFPWNNYRPIFTWAREKKIRLLALNRPRVLFQKTERVELHERDQWAAGIITDMFCEQLAQGVRPKILALYGELHVGTQHLPRQLKKISRSFLKKPLSSASIYQNEDHLYWKLARDNSKLEPEAVRIGKSNFCVFSGTPWAKLQSLVDWLEKSVPQIADESNDHLYTMQTYGQTIAQLLQVPPPNYETVNLYTIDQAEELKSILERFEVTQKTCNSERMIREFFISHNLPIYLPQLGVAYAGTFSHNALAELAAWHMIRMHHPVGHIYNGERDDFFRVILTSTFAFLGSLILNPRRKCDFIQDHRERIAHLLHGGTAAYPDEREVREFTLKLLTHESASNAPLFDSPDPLVGVLAGRYLGRTLGKTLHRSLMDGAVGTPKLKTIFLPAPDTEIATTYESRYRQLRGMIDPLPETAKRADYF